MGREFETYVERNTTGFWYRKLNKVTLVEDAREDRRIILN
jgi:hypothetical protein